MNVAMVAMVAMVMSPVLSLQALHLRHVLLCYRPAGPENRTSEVGRKLLTAAPKHTADRTGHVFSLCYASTGRRRWRRHSDQIAVLELKSYWNTPRTNKVAIAQSQSRNFWDLFGLQTASCRTGDDEDFFLIITVSVRFYWITALTSPKFVFLV